MPRKNATPASRLSRPASKRGGRRPGAGAPKGNMNRLSSGLRSRQMKTFIIVNMAVPELRNVLFRLHRMSRRETALLALAINDYARLLQLPSRQRSIKSVRANLSPQTRDLLRSIKRLTDRHPGLSAAPAPARACPSLQAGVEKRS